MTEVKFCGMTREEDVRQAALLGASFVGAILTESPRRVEAARARELFGQLAGSTVKSVAVFGDEPLAHIIRMAEISGCDVVQLHGRGPGNGGDLGRLRAAIPVAVWRAIRVAPDGIDGELSTAFPDADGVLLDTMVRGALGGTGVTFDWTATAMLLRQRPAGRKLIVAGGLRPENVREAIERLAPDVVDVSSGVESAPGVKDHRLMEAFMAAVRQSTPAAPIR